MLKNYMNYSYFARKKEPESLFGIKVELLMTHLVFEPQ